MVSWDAGIEAAREGIAARLLDLVRTGRVFRGRWTGWFQRVADAESTVAYGVFPPLEGEVARTLDGLLAAGRIRVVETRPLWGMYHVAIA